MAQRRMFSKAITESARFIKMPLETQALYFHLCLSADDDGIVEAFSIMRMVGTTEDSIKVLAAKGFVKVLNEDLVAWITDWSEHNLIRPDRKVDSLYKDLLLQIVPEARIVKQKPRADTGKPTGRPMDNPWTAQVRLGEISINTKENSERIEKLKSQIKAKLPS